MEEVPPSGWLPHIRRFWQVYVVGRKVKLLCDALTTEPLQLQPYTKVKAALNFRIEITPHGVAVITVDVKDSKVNTLGEWVAQLAQAMSQLELDPTVIGVVITSGKKDGFVAGLDIKLLNEDEFRTPEGLRKLIPTFHSFLTGMERGKPKVAAVHGACLGGGMELALACHVRVASANPKTVFALPEVRLGLLPGAGGTQRLPALIGVWPALPMLLAGVSKSAHAALRLNIVDCLESDAASVLPRAVQQCLDLHRRTQRHGDHYLRSLVASSQRSLGSVLSRAAEAVIRYVWPVRALLFWVTEKKTMAVTKGHYPAPIAIMQVLRSSLDRGVLCSKGGFSAEQDGFISLALSSQSRGLRSAFFASSAAKKPPFNHTPSPALPHVGLLVPSASPHVGWRLALRCVENGVHVRLVGSTMELLSRRCFVPLRRVLDTRVKEGRLSVGERDGMLARVVLTRTMGELCHDMHDSWKTAFMKCTVILHPAAVDVAAQRNFASLISPHVEPATTFVFGVSPSHPSLTPSPHVLGFSLDCPDVGTTKIVEIVTNKQTSDVALSVVWDLVLNTQKLLPVVCEEGQGRQLVPRLYAAYFLAAMDEVLERGVSISDLSRAIRRRGFDSTPFGIADSYGLAKMKAAVQNLQRSVTSQQPPVTSQGAVAFLDHLIDSGALGVDSGAGFYLYPQGRSSKHSAKVNPKAHALVAKMQKRRSVKAAAEEGGQRVMWHAVAAALSAWEDGVVSSTEVVDLTAITSLGWPPFLGGGPLGYVDEEGMVTCARAMRNLEIPVPGSLNRDTCPFRNPPGESRLL